MVSCARATRGLRRMGRERPGALLARRTRTVKLGSFDARSEGRFAYSLGEVENRWESLDACGEEARGRTGQYPARPREDESAELLGRDDLEEFDLEH